MQLAACTGKSGVQADLYALVRGIVQVAEKELGVQVVIMALHTFAKPAVRTHSGD